MSTFLRQSLPVAMIGNVGSTLPLTTLLNNAFGANASSIDGAWIAHYGPAALQQWNFDYWNPSTPTVSKWQLNGTPIADSTVGSYEQYFVSKADFATTSIKLGNCIGPFVYLLVRIDIGASDPVYIQYRASTNTLGLSVTAPGNRAPTGAEIAAAAEAAAAKFPNVPNDNDCHNISWTIAASMGAPLPDQSGDINPVLNKEGGFWRIVHRGTDNVVTDWLTLTKPGDIVRFDWADPSEPQHTTLIVGNLQPDGSVMVVDNSDFRGGSTSYIGRHLARYDQQSDDASVTIYRIAADQRYLIETTNAPETVLGTNFNDLLKALSGNDIIKAGNGNDLVEAGNGNDMLYGQAGNDILNGGADNDVIDGGPGADTMAGGTGDDTYFVDNIGDKVVEAVNQGTDSVRAGTSYALAANVSVETLQTLGGTSATVINLTGNNLVNKIYGNAAANRIDGGGGADTMTGLNGNDTYVVDNPGDQINEVSSGGTDNVRASTTYVLAAGVSVEVMQTLGGTSSTQAINLVGNDLVNNLIGNAAANILNAGAGNDLLQAFAGNDTLVGGAGKDVFVFNTALNASTNVDKINDYAPVDDTMRLENAVFTTLAAGALPAGAFNTGAAATQPDDRIVYNSANGDLIYDSNGNAGGGATLFAKLASGLALTNADFVVI